MPAMAPLMPTGVPRSAPRPVTCLSPSPSPVSRMRAEPVIAQSPPLPTRGYASPRRTASAPLQASPPASPVRRVQLSPCVSPIDLRTQASSPASAARRVQPSPCTSPADGRPPVAVAPPTSRPPLISGGQQPSSPDRASFPRAKHGYLTPPANILTSLGNIFAKRPKSQSPQRGAAAQHAPGLVARLVPMLEIGACADEPKRACFQRSESEPACLGGRNEQPSCPEPAPEPANERESKERLSTPQRSARLPSPGHRNLSPLVARLTSTPRTALITPRRTTSAAAVSEVAAEPERARTKTGAAEASSPPCECRQGGQKGRGLPRSGASTPTKPCAREVTPRQESPARQIKPATPRSEATNLVVYNRETLLWVEDRLQARAHEKGPSAKPPRFEVEGDERQSKENSVNYDEISWREAIGAGSFGAVWRARYHGAQVAVKQCKVGGDQKDVDMLIMEIRYLQRFRHQRLVSYLGCCFHKGHVVLLMEFMEGGSLYSLLFSRKKALVFADKARMARQVAGGLSYLHELHVVHRDLKTMNIVMDAALNCKICDFGLTITLEKTHATVRALQGSPRYMAPEQFDMEVGAKITEKVDIWQMGCVMLELFCGVVPFSNAQGVAQIATELLVRRKPPSIPAAADPLARALIHACLRIQASKRPAAADLQDALNGVWRAAVASSS
mmetsp:Transcript_102207/g.288731  ORF Transcript_102207/g.288731 Transcript_102207/m.288731 type:complete len:675 (+) Transcript_102207:90-2114(+)